MNLREFQKTHEDWKKSEPDFSPEQRYLWEPGDMPPGHYKWKQSEPSAPSIMLGDEVKAFVKPDGYLHLKDVHTFNEMYMEREDALKLAEWIKQVYG